MTTYINLQAHDAQWSGYGRMGLELRKSLSRLGVESAGDVNEDDVIPCREALWLSTPQSIKGYFEGQHRTLFSMWESTQMPAGFRENLHAFDRVVVPSQQNLELFSKFHPDVVYCPLGIDPVAWKYEPRRPVSSHFNFLTAGYGARKNVAYAVRAFHAAFPGGQPIGDGPIPRLFVLSADDVGGPGVCPISSRLSAEQEISLYAQAHCFVSPSRGEGFGLMPLQAIAQGCPTILGAAHGHAAFAHLGIPITTHPISAARATFWGDGGHWWEPDFDELVTQMRNVYGNPDAEFTYASKQSWIAKTLFTWDNAATKLLAAIPEIDETCDALWDPAPAWVNVQARRYLIRVNQTCTYGINGIDYHFVPGKDYWESGDLKRQIIQNGQLDMTAFNPDEWGLDADQVAELTARNERCGSCHQKYGVDPDRYKADA